MSKSKIIENIDNLAEELYTISDGIWDHPETGYKEHYAVESLTTSLKKHGFKVKDDYGSIPTAFTGEYGSGHPVIGFLGEFDALSELSQKENVFEKEEVAKGMPGHGCGHNLLGVGSLGAAIATKQYLEENNLPGTVIYFGCPSEEEGSGKAFMARDGIFDPLDCALTWHPDSMNITMKASSLANVQLTYNFKGISSHAAGSPHMGRSALDALELMNVGVQFLREHIIDEARVHYAVTDAGGLAPNVVQAHAESLYLIRAPKNDQVKHIMDRVNKVAEGAALMTETKVDYKVIKGCSNVLPNSVLTEKLYENMKEVALPEYTESDVEYAKKVQDSFAQKPDLGLLEKAAKSLPADQAKQLQTVMAKPIRNFVLPLAPFETTMASSTDVGDVSWVCPTTQFLAATMAGGTPGHSWQLVSQGKSDIAHKGMLWAAKVLTSTAIDLIDHPEIVEEAKKEHKERLSGNAYISPIPKGVDPRI